MTAKIRLEIFTVGSNMTLLSIPMETLLPLLVERGIYSCGFSLGMPGANQELILRATTASGHVVQEFYKVPAADDESEPG